MSEFAKPWLEFEKELGLRPLLYGPLKSCFDGWAKLGATLVSKYEFPPPDSSVKTEERNINDNVKVRIYTPDGYVGGKTIGVYYHGGGWAMGDLDMDDAWCRIMAKGVGVMIVSVEYRLAPAHKFPTPLNDCYDGYIWTLKNAAGLGGKEGKLFISGQSAGGHLSIAVALKVIDEGLGDSLQGIAPQMPVTLHPDACPEAFKSEFTAYQDNNEHTVNTASAMAAFSDAYGAPPSNKYTSVILHDRIKDLPKVYLTGASMDTLRDDVRVFKKVLDQNKVPNIFDEYEGYPHLFFTFPSKLLDEPRRDYTEKLIKGLEFILS